MGSCFFMRRSTEEAHVGEDKAAPLIIFSVRSTRAFNGQREARGSEGGHTVFSALPSLARASGPPRQPGTSRSAFRVLGPPWDVEDALRSLLNGFFSWYLCKGSPPGLHLTKSLWLASIIGSCARWRCSSGQRFASKGLSLCSAARQRLRAGLTFAEDGKSGTREAAPSSGPCWMPKPPPSPTAGAGPCTRPFSRAPGRSSGFKRARLQA